MIDYKKYGMGKAFFGYVIIMFITLVVCIASVLVFAVTISPNLKGIYSIIIFSIIPLLYGSVSFYLYRKAKPNYNKLDEKRQFIFDVCIGACFYIVIMLTLFLIFLFSLYFPLEARGINNEYLQIKIQPYLINNEALVNYNQSEISYTNQIYSKYNITLQINQPILIEREINESYKTLILQQNCSILDELYNLTDKKKDSVKLIVINYNGTATDGMASICGNGNMVLMSANTTISSGWVLAHEMGHILNAKISCWRFNLMKEYSGECYAANWVTHNFIRDLRPDFLSQKQVDVMVKTIKNRQVN